MNQVKGSGPPVCCNCEKCKGQIEYEYEHMLDPTGQAISRFCADGKTLLNILADMPGIPRTNAEYELKQVGYVKFYVIYYNAPLDPYIKAQQLHRLFKEIDKTLRP